MKFGAFSHRLETQLKAVVSILDVKGEFTDPLTQHYLSAFSKTKRLNQPRPIGSKAQAESASGTYRNLAFGGSFLFLWVTGAGAFVLYFLQLLCGLRKPLNASIFKHVILFGFCTDANVRRRISIGILPGYLILYAYLFLSLCIILTSPNSERLQKNCRAGLLLDVL